ncbi:MAG: ABC transporter permease subunit [Acidobacteriia bacterium]|nr:ABC transporter permease subunit [Terriglobia bacterium]
MAARWMERGGIVAFAVALLYPLSALLAPVGPWRWDQDVAPQTMASIRVSLGLTAIAMMVVLLVGTPVAIYIARASFRERLLWQGALLLSILLPPLALGILLSIAFGPSGAAGGWLEHFGMRVSNNPPAFVATQVYVSIGYYVLGAIAAFQAVPAMLEKHAALLGQPPWAVFWRVTFPLSRLGLAAALSVAWVRALGEFGAVVITAYYPSGMPVQLWINLQSFGLPAVMPLLVVFLAAALPLPWIIHLLAQRRPHA